MPIKSTEFDEGHLSSDPVAAQKELKKILAIMEDTEPPIQPKDNPIRYVFQITWDRIKKVIVSPITLPIFK